MAAPVRRSAATLCWTTPSGQTCTLSPLSGGLGILEVEVRDDVVDVHSRNCVLHTNDEEDSYTELAEFEFSVSLHRCQINWSLVEKTETGDIERSKYFSN